MDLNQLALFVRVVEAGSFTAAAAPAHAWFFSLRLSRNSGQCASPRRA